MKKKYILECQRNNLLDVGIRPWGVLKVICLYDVQNYLQLYLTNFVNDFS